jgi:soluble lytic murein transglycosylase-like protein
VVVIGAVGLCALLGAPAAGAASGSVAALQVALRAHRVDPGPVDGVRGPLTRRALVTFQRRSGIEATGKVGRATRRALGRMGRPLLGQRELRVGLRGWDVASLEFRLRRYGLPRNAIDGRFTPATSAALRRFQRATGLSPDGIAGPNTYRALARKARGGARLALHTVRPGEGFFVIAGRYRIDPFGLARANGLTISSVLVPGQRLRLPGVARPQTRSAPIVHVVRPGESFFSISQVFRVSPWQLARVNRLSLTNVIVPGQRLRLPAGAKLGATLAPVDRETVRSYLNHWAAVYGVDPTLVRALAWMESGFQQDVVSSVGALGVMQLLPETWEWVDTMLIGQPTPRTAAGNVQAGVRYLRWQLDEFGGNVRLALAGWYQGARAVREIGLYDDTKQFVTVVLRLYGSV